ncbi:protein xmas [Drosophila biarmipes]|uniref:protein xmas n=1 Tax=Drosophila biarmipes TaxID=125945 RepID=UPI0007E7C0B0|nr:protein xmas [Drosophila biarmipes]
MKSIVAQTEGQLRPVKVSRFVSVLKSSLGESQGNTSAVYKVVARMTAGQVEFRWSPHLASLAGRPDEETHVLWRPYVSFNTRLTRKLSGAMERRGSSINFLGRSLAKKGSHPRVSTCVLPVKTRHAPKTVQGREWPIWRQSSVRPLLLPSSNLWTGVLSQRFYVPRLRPVEEDEVERRAVPQLTITREQAEEEEQQLQRRRDGSRLRNQHSPIPMTSRAFEEEDFQEHREQHVRHRKPYLPSELMTPQMASKWQTSNSLARGHREQQLLNLEQQMKTQPTVRMTTQTWVSGNHRRHRSRQPSAPRVPVVSELEGWRRSANHQPVPTFEGKPAEQERLRHASCKTSARSMKDVQETSKMVWEPEEKAPWGRTKETAGQSGRMPTIRAAKSALPLAQESRSKHHRLITKEVVYRPREANPEAEHEQAQEEADPRHRPTGGGKRGAKRSPERELLKQHLADLLASVQDPGSFRIGYQPNAPTRQLLEQGKCYVSLRRDQLMHLQFPRPNSLIQAADLEVRESPRNNAPVTTLHRKDGAKRPRPVEVVVKPSLLTVIRQQAATWDHNGRRVDKRSNSMAVRPKKEASLRHLVRNASSLEFIVKAQPRRKWEPKPKSSVTDFHNVVIKKLPQVSSTLDICRAAHPFKDLEEPRTKEKEVAASWKQAHVARNYKYEASTSYRSGAHPGRRSSTRDMTEGYFLAKRSSSTAVNRPQGSSRKVKPPRQPVVSPKVQVPSVQRKQRSQDDPDEEATNPPHVSHGDSRARPAARSTRSVFTSKSRTSKGKSTFEAEFQIEQ